MSKPPFPKKQWGEFWTPPVEDDAPFPADVEMDCDTGRWRYVINREQYREEFRVWEAAVLGQA